MRARIRRDDKPDILVGTFHETPAGEIVLVTGWNGGDRRVRYRSDDADADRNAAEADYDRWTPRAELSDFPAARDPRLPYSFDLHFDVKRRSQLVELLKQGGAEADQARETMKSHGIALTAQEEHEIAQAGLPAPR